MTENETVLNNFFFNAVTNSKIPEHSRTDTWAANISHSVLIVIFKYGKHPNIDTVNNFIAGEKCQLKMLWQKLIN